VKKLRVVIPTLGGGGLERTCVALCQEWVASGLTVELILIKREGVFLRDLPQAVRVIDLNKPRIRYAFWGLLKTLRADSTPILVFHFDVGVICGFYRLLRVIKGEVTYCEGNLPAWNVSLSRRWMYRAFLSHVDRVIAQSEFARGDLSRVGVRRNVAVIPNPAPWKMNPGTVESPLNTVVHGGAVKLVAIGRLSYEKGFDRLIGAMPKIIRARPGSTLTIYGEGGQRETLQGIINALGISKSVVLAGFVNITADRFHESDIFVLSSRYEGQPNVLIEAIGYGARAIAAGGGGVRELMQSCGLDDVMIDDENFGSDVVVKVGTATQKPKAYWDNARHKLIQIMDRQRNANYYWQFSVGTLPAKNYSH
jgi:glycosyltransferase involved in cell wall biosynthesis